jgi:hypothetical protein
LTPIPLRDVRGAEERASSSGRGDESAAVAVVHLQRMQLIKRILKNCMLEGLEVVTVGRSSQAESIVPCSTSPFTKEDCYPDEGRRRPKVKEEG